MRYFTAVLLSLFLFASEGQPHPSTETVTYKIEGVEYPHPAPWFDHNYVHKTNVQHLWEHEMGAFDHVVDNLDRRIDHLNAALKSLYLITCASALARPDECTRFVAVMHELLAYNKSHVVYTCPFNLVTDVIPVFHDNNLHVDRQLFVWSIVYICGELNIQNDAQLIRVSTFMKNWIATDHDAIIYKKQHTYHISADFNTYGFIDHYRASTPH